MAWHSRHENGRTRLDRDQNSEIGRARKDIERGKSENDLDKLCALHPSTMCGFKVESRLPFFKRAAGKTAARHRESFSIIYRWHRESSSLGFISWNLSIARDGDLDRLRANSAARLRQL